MGSLRRSTRLGTLGGSGSATRPLHPPAQAPSLDTHASDLQLAHGSRPSLPTAPVSYQARPTSFSPSASKRCCWAATLHCLRVGHVHRRAPNGRTNLSHGVHHGRATQYERFAPQAGRRCASSRPDPGYRGFQHGCGRLAQEPAVWSAPIGAADSADAGRPESPGRPRGARAAAAALRNPIEPQGVARDSLALACAAERAGHAKRATRLGERAVCA